ncbi:MULTISPECIES: daptide-type RiPP [unclassified Streptomyces]|uniref:daptide-type RiPP n=1 Tax=unclassified Streptomyces TaxID=2593676 RepID=UPI002E2CA8A9|nr:daptide-type RiPP [Streptomyces sp. NBC_00223]
MNVLEKSSVDHEIAALELGLQELETLEAPGFWTGVGVVVGVVAASAVAYGSYALTAAVVAT